MRVWTSRWPASSRPDRGNERLCSPGLDMGYVGVAPVTAAMANKSARVVVLAQVNSEGSCLIVKKDPGLQNLSDLKGKTLAVPGHATVQDFLLRRVLGKWNLLPPQTQILVLKPPEMISALRNGDIDGFIAWEPFPTRAVILEAGRSRYAPGRSGRIIPAVSWWLRSDFWKAGLTRPER